MVNNSRLGIIDLGSNTFHLLICDIAGSSFTEVHRERIFVALAEGGIDTIKQSAIDRAKDAFEAMAKSIEKYKPAQLKIIGTAALRSASNSAIIQELSSEILGQSIEIIVGDREADLIYKGVSLVAKMNQGSHLIMDIGGGSTEFIIVDNGAPQWSQSFNIGVGILHESFHKTEPIASNDIENLKQWLTDKLEPLITELNNYNISTLIGASGSFEIIANMSGLGLPKNDILEVPVAVFDDLKRMVVSSNMNERASLPGMPETRVKLSVVAFLKLGFILDLVKPRTIVVSPYALKEGLLSEMVG